MHEDAGVAEVPQRQAERDVALLLVERDDAHLRAKRCTAATENASRGRIMSRHGQCHEQRDTGRARSHGALTGPVLTDRGCLSTSS